MLAFHYKSPGFLNLRIDNVPLVHVLMKCMIVWPPYKRGRGDSKSIFSYFKEKTNFATISTAMCKVCRVIDVVILIVIIIC